MILCQNKIQRNNLNDKIVGIANLHVLACSYIIYSSRLFLLLLFLLSGFFPWFLSLCTFWPLSRLCRSCTFCWGTPSTGWSWFPALIVTIFCFILARDIFNSSSLAPNLVTYPTLRWFLHLTDKIAMETFLTVPGTTPLAHVCGVGSGTSPSAHPVQVQPSITAN